MDMSIYQFHFNFIYSFPWYLLIIILHTLYFYFTDWRFYFAFEAEDNVGHPKHVFQT